MRGGINVNKKPISCRRVSDEQYNMKEVQEVVEKFDEVVGSHDSQ